MIRGGAPGGEETARSVFPELIRRTNARLRPSGENAGRRSHTLSPFSVSCRQTQVLTEINTRFPSCPAAMDSLSGVQARPVEKGADTSSANFRSGPPSGEISITDPCRRNAIHLPSGDQAGD